MKTLRPLILGSALLLAAVPALVAAGAAIDPSAKAVIDRSITAMGGASAITAIRTLVMEGVMEMPSAQMKIAFNSRLKSPDLILFEGTIPGMGKTAQGFDGTTAWAKDPMQGYRELTGKDREQFVNSSRMDRFLRLEVFFAKIESLPDQTIDGKPTKVIKATPTVGDPENLYYDAKSGLPIRWDITIDAGPMGKLPTQNRLDDWRELPGTKVRYPFSMKTTNPAMQMNTTVTSVTLNVPLEDSVFAPQK